MEKKTFFAQNEELVVLHDKCSPLFTLCGRSGSMWFDNRFPTLSEVKARDNHGQHSRITDDSDVVQVRCAHVTVSKMASSRSKQLLHLHIFFQMPVYYCFSSPRLSADFLCCRSLPTAMLAALCFVGSSQLLPSQPDIWRSPGWTGVLVP